MTKDKNAPRRPKAAGFSGLRSLKSRTQRLSDRQKRQHSRVIARINILESWILDVLSIMDLDPELLGVLASEEE